MERNGYEYRVVGYCKSTGRPLVTPIAWSSKDKVRPVYATCLCCSRKS